MVTPTDILIPGTSKYYLIWKKSPCSCDSFKDFEMKRLCWIVLWVITPNPSVLRQRQREI